MANDFDNSDWSLRPPGFRPEPTGLLTRRELAECLAVDVQTIGKWEREGLPVALTSGPGRPSYFSEADVRAWLRERAERAGSKSADASEAVTARAQRDLWQARLAEQEHQKRSRELVHVAEVEKVWMAEVFAVRAVLLNLPVAYADRVYRVAKDNAAGVEAILKAAVYEALRELSTEGRPLPYAAAPHRTATAEKAAPAVIRRDAFVQRIDQEGKP